MTTIELDTASDTLTMHIVGEYDDGYQPGFQFARAAWVSRRRLRADFSRTVLDQRAWSWGAMMPVYSEQLGVVASGFEAVISEDGGTLTWVTGAVVHPDPAEIRRKVRSP